MSSRAAAPEDLAHTLVPLPLAAHLLLMEVYGRDFLGARTPVEDKLNAVATALSALVPIFEHERRSWEGARVIPGDELADGRFSSGAKEFQFRKGRRTGFLAVSAADVSYVIQLLK